MRWLNAVGRRVRNLSARGYRSVLERPVFIGVTGSVGKTTTKELLAAMLRTRFRGRENVGSENTIAATGWTVLSVRPTDDFCVQEIGINPYTAHASLDGPISIFRPDVAVVTRVARDHVKQYPTEDAVAAEKVKLVQAVPADGMAILNHDDPRVRAMSAFCAGRVLSYGRTPGAWLFADEVSSAWPDRLRLRMHCDGGSVTVQTRFCGEFWVDSILAAAATALGLGIALDVIAEVLASHEPVSGRMSAETDASGVSFIRDDWKATGSTIPAMLEFARQARASRKILVVGTIFDPPDELPRYYPQLAALALRAADLVFFVGPTSHHVLGVDTDRVRRFPTVRSIAEHFRAFLRKGDLVLIAGMHTQDHLERLVMDRRQAIACWKAQCGRGLRCYECDLASVAAAD